MPPMKAAVFVAPGKIEIREKPIPRNRTNGCVDSRDDDYHLRHRRPHSEGRVSG